MSVRKYIIYIYISVFLFSCNITKYPGVLPPSQNVAGYEVAKESVFRQIPEQYIDFARTTLSISYTHTSHGTHVTYGLNGLQSYRAGDEILYGMTINAATRDPNKLDFHDTATTDLSQADNVGDSYAAWMSNLRTYLGLAENASINIVMWSWCDISGHNINDYLNAMQTMINEYGPGGTSIGTGPGQRAIPVTFIFMTGHSVENNNIGNGRPKNQADLIVNFCDANDYWCLDYFSIESHDINNNYYPDVGEDSDSALYGGNFFQDWQDRHILGIDWFYNRNNSNGVDPGQHLYQHISANRKAYATWYLFARIAGWNGNNPK